MRGKKEREHERESIGEKKSIATPGVTAAVIAFKSEGSHFLIQSCFKVSSHFLCRIKNIRKA